MKKLKKETKYIVTAIISVIILSGSLGGSYFAVQYNKQKSIEFQQERKIRTELLLQEQEIERDMLMKEGLADCYDEADDLWWVYIENNGTDKGDGLWSWDSYTGNEADKIKDRKIKQCNVMWK